MKQVKPQNFIVLEEIKTENGTRNQTIEKGMLTLNGPPVRASINTSQPFKQRK